MAGADYKSCDKCGCKTFYDAVLDYDFDEEEDNLRNKETGLWNTGDHKSLCNACSINYELVIMKKLLRKG